MILLEITLTYHVSLFKSMCAYLGFVRLNRARIQ